MAYQSQETTTSSTNIAEAPRISSVRLYIITLTKESSRTCIRAPVATRTTKAERAADTASALVITVKPACAWGNRRVDYDRTTGDIYCFGYQSCGFSNQRYAA